MKSETVVKAKIDMKTKESLVLRERNERKLQRGKAGNQIDTSKLKRERKKCLQRNNFLSSGGQRW